MDGPIWAAIPIAARSCLIIGNSATTAQGPDRPRRSDGAVPMPGCSRLAGSGKSNPSSAGVLLANVADHIDYVCQLAGNTRHAALDRTGWAFGREQSPPDLESIADLQKMASLLQARGFPTRTSIIFFMEFSAFSP